MLTLRHHNSNDYEMLPDIDDADTGALTFDDEACLEEIGGSLLQASAQRRFGATLLHSHFPIQDDEILVEEIQPEAQLITLQPTRSNSLELFPTNICFDNPALCGSHLRLIGLEFASWQALAGVAPIGEIDHNILASIAEILQRRGKTSRFGIRLLHDPLKLNGKVLFETCDSVRRVLICRSGPEDESTLAQSIPTVFQWGDFQASGEGDWTIGQECTQFCRRIQRCNKPVHGTHRSSTNHDTSHGRL